MRVGLTGGIGSGKSEVARRFAARGALVIDADELAREAVAPGTQGLAAIAQRWPQVINEEGSLDRAALSAIVFANDGERRALEAIVHPEVRRLADEREAGAEPGRLVVHVIPLLFEGDAWKRFDANVLVFAPREARLARVIARDATSPEAVEARMLAQIDPERARELADYIIENDAGLATLDARADAVYEALLMRA